MKHATTDPVIHRDQSAGGGTVGMRAPNHQNVDTTDAIENATGTPTIRLFRRIVNGPAPE